MTSKMPNFFLDVLQELGNENGWPSRPVRPIFKVKRAPKQAYPPFGWFSCDIANHFMGDPDSDFKNSKNYCGRPSRPWICSRFALTASPSQFQGQTRPEARIPPFQWFSCAISNHFLGDPDFDVKNVKTFCGSPSWPWLWIRFIRTDSLTYFKGQTSPEARISPI